MIHLRARSGLHASSSLLFLCLLTGPDCRTRAGEVTGNIVFAGDSLTAGTGAGPRGSFPAQTLAILGRGWKGHNSGTSGRWARQALEDYDASIGRYFDRSSRHFSLNTTDGLSEIIRFGLESYGLRPCK